MKGKVGHTRWDPRKLGIRNLREAQNNASCAPELCQRDDRQRFEISVKQYGSSKNPRITYFSREHTLEASIRRLTPNSTNQIGRIHFYFFDSFKNKFEIYS